MLGLLSWKAGGFGFPFGVLLPLALLGLAGYWRQIPVPLKLFLILYPLSIILVFVVARYRAPVIPVMSVPAAAGLIVLIRSIRLHCWRRLVFAVVSTAVIVPVSTLPGPFPEEQRPNYEAELYANVGAMELFRGQYQTATIHLKKSLQIMPDNSMAHANLGVALFRQDKTEEAIRHCEKSLHYKPDSPDMLNNLGTVLSSVGRLDEAIECYHQALQINPYNSSSHFNLGHTFFEQKKFKGAADSYQKAIEINPGYTKAYVNLGHACYELGKMDEATNYYEKALQVDPEFSEARPNISWMYNYKAKKLAHQNKIDEAVIYFQRAVEIYPIDVNNHIILAETLASQGRYDQAVAALKKSNRFYVTNWQ